MWSIQKFWTDPVLPRSSCTAFRVNGRTNRSILKEVVAGFCDGGTTTQKKMYYQIFADGVYKYGFCSTRSKWLTNPLLRRIYTSRWIRPPKRSFKSRLKNILGSIRNSLTWCLFLWNFGTICSPSVLPLDWFSACNNFFSWAVSQELEFSLQTLH